MNFKLGKGPHREDSKRRTLLLPKYLKKLPDVPSSFKWGDKVETWPMFKNDAVGDCFVAAIGHAIQCWTTNDGAPFVPSDDDIITGYSGISGYDPATGANDNGCDPLEGMNYWVGTGVAGRKAGGYVSVPSSKDYLVAASYLFGGLPLGIELPKSAERQIGPDKIWDVPFFGPWGDGAPGSLGGHMVHIVDFCDGLFVCVTWGFLQRMTVDFVKTYGSDRFAVLDEDWYGSDGKCPAGIDKEQLKADLDVVKTR